MPYESSRSNSQCPSLSTLFRWSIRHFLARKRNCWLLAIFSLLAVFSQALSHFQALKIQSAVVEIRESERKRLDVYRSAFSNVEPTFSDEDSREERQIKTQRMIAKLPTSLAYSGGIDSATYMPNPLAAMSVGYSDIWPSRYRITAHSRRQNLEREDITSPFRRLVGPWDSATFVLIALPLAVILLTHDIVSSEREGGTLSLLLINPVQVRVFFLLKFLICGLSLAGLLIVTHVGAALLLTSVEFLPLMLWSLVVILYTAFWIAFAWAMNSFETSSVTNAMVLTLTWGLTTIVVPAGISNAAQHWHPVQDNAFLITKERRLREKAEQNSQKLVDAYYQAHPKVDRPSRKEDPYGQTRWDAIREEVDRQMHPLLAERLSAMEQRTQFVERFGFLDPALATKLAMDELAGTGLHDFVTFAQRSLAYDQEYKEYFQPLMMARGELSAEAFVEIPTFAERSDSMSLRANLLMKCGLASAGWTTALLLFGWIQLRRL